VRRVISVSRHLVQLFFAIWITFVIAVIGFVILGLAVSELVPLL
jgi:hypothetical protein